MKTIMSLVLMFSTSTLLRAQITGNSSSWTTAYCNEEYGLNYKTAAVPLNQRVSSLAGTGSVQAANLPISGIPGSIQVRKVFLWFSIVGQTTAVTSFPSLTVKDPLGTTLPISNLTCVSTISNSATSWQGSPGTNFASGNTHNYRAEITLTGSTYNGNYTISGLPTVTTTNPDVDVTGATLMIIYKDLNDCSKGSLFIQDTYMKEGLSYSNTFSSLNMCFSTPPINTSFTQFVNSVDYEKSNAYCQLLPDFSQPFATFNGDMWNFVSQTGAFNDGSSTAPVYWATQLDNDYVVTATDHAFTSVRGFYWKGAATSMPITSSFTVNYVNCSGVVNVNGSASTGSIANHYWEIIECNSSGVPTLGGYSYNTWVAGAPTGNFSFPAVPCGKYYRIKLATQNACNPWVETTQIRYVSCPPSLKLAKTPFEICDGESVGLSVTITGANPANCTMVWAPISPAGPAIYSGSPASILVSPTVTTTYQCTVTDVTTGCFATIQKTITVINTDPSFSFTKNTTNPNYFTIAATPNNITPMASQPAGFGYAWFVEELNVNTNAQIFIANNPGAWWTFNPPGVIANNFNCFDHVANNYSGDITSTLPVGCNTPAIGKFLYNRKYRITRGTWSDNCAWKQYSEITISVKSADGTQDVIFVEDKDAPDFSHLVAGMNSPSLENEWTIFPNPGTGRYTIEWNNATEVSIEIYNMMGEKVLNTNQTGISASIDLTGSPSGIYLVKITTNGEQACKKIILE